MYVCVCVCVGILDALTVKCTAAHVLNQLLPWLHVRIGGQNSFEFGNLGVPQANEPNCKTYVQPSSLSTDVE